MILEGRKDSHAVLQSLLEPAADHDHINSHNNSAEELTPVIHTPIIESHGLW